MQGGFKRSAERMAQLRQKLAEEKAHAERERVSREWESLPLCKACEVNRIVPGSRRKHYCSDECALKAWEWAAWNYRARVYRASEPVRPATFSYNMPALGRTGLRHVLFDRMFPVSRSRYIFPASPCRSATN